LEKKKQNFDLPDKNKNKIFYEGCKNNAPLTPNHECGQQAIFTAIFLSKVPFFRAPKLPFQN
jgi:hypothetical protein